MQVLERPSASLTPASSDHRLRPVGDVSESEARAELARVIGSADFPASERNRRFLVYSVDRAFQNGSGHLRVTAWDVAVHVYGRPESFNSLLDPIVRIEAGKLRRDLETYYLKSGRSNPLRIEIPRGGYDVVFMRHAPGATDAAVAEAPAATGRLAEDAAAELARVLASRDFPATARNRKFLSFVVEKELAGAAQDVTPTILATKILGRGAGFEPNKDPIVRIEAARLRRDLETYYLKSGQANPLRIRIPKGGYRPVFDYV